MDGIAKARRQSLRMRGRSYVALAFCPAVPSVGWLEEIDVPLARSPGFSAGHRSPRYKPGTTELPHPWHRERGCRSPHDAHAALADRRTLLLLVQNEPKKPEAKPKPNLLLDSPVRSGQAISNEGDVTVLGVRSVQARRLSPVGPSMFMGRFAVVRWRVPAATLQLGKD